MRLAVPLCAGLLGAAGVSLHGGPANRHASKHMNRSSQSLDKEEQYPISNDLPWNWVAACNRSIKTDYRCNGDKYHKWQQSNIRKLNEWRNKARTILKKAAGGQVLYIGNSFVGTLYQDLLCQFHSEIVKWEVTEYRQIYQRLTVSGNPIPAETTFDHYPLVEKRWGFDFTDGVFRDGVAYIPEISKATFSNGAVIAAGYNARFLFEGFTGLDRLMEHLNLRMDKLKMIVFNGVNDDTWARDYAFERTYSGDISPLLKRGLYEYLNARGFHGHVMIWSNFLFPPQEVKAPTMVAFNKFKIRSVDDPDLYLNNVTTICNVPVCDDARREHQCVPGVSGQVNGEMGRILRGI